jgi:hypothetical protein
LAALASAAQFLRASYRDAALSTIRLAADVPHARVVHRPDVTHVVAFGGFELDDIGTKSGKDLRREWAHDHRGEVENLDAAKRPAVFGRHALLSGLLHSQFRCPSIHACLLCFAPLSGCLFWADSGSVVEAFIWFR